MSREQVSEPGRGIAIRTVPNLRDLGGWRTEDGGRIRSGVLYRSVRLSGLSGGDIARFEALGLKTIFDLRTGAERDEAPDVSTGAREVHLDVIADSPDSAPGHILETLRDPALANEAFGDGKAALVFDRAYREFIELPSADAAFATLFTEIAEEPNLPALYHCTTGKDRTGWATASLLLFLGVPEEDVFHEFLLTNAQLLPAMQGLFDEFREAGGDPEILRPVLGVKEEYLRNALDLATGRYGSIQGYFDEGLKLTPEIQEALRSRLVEPG